MSYLGEALVVLCLRHSQEYGREIDMWALGVITFVVLSGALPFYHQVLHKLYRQIVERDLSFPDQAWKNPSATHGCEMALVRQASTASQARIVAKLWRPTITVPMEAMVACPGQCRTPWSMHTRCEACCSLEEGRQGLLGTPGKLGMAGRMQGHAGLPSKFRLIFADPAISGGSIMQMMELPTPLTMAKDLCDQRGVKAADAGILLQGLDGPRRSPLHSDKDIDSFLHNLQTSRIPVIEAQLPYESMLQAASELHASAPSRRHRGRDPRDQIEELEDANDKLTRATDRVERRLAELELSA
eukprot:g9739.t1